MRKAAACGLALAASCCVWAAVWMDSRSGTGPATQASVDYYLWAWRRAEDLGFAAQVSAKVAVWTATVFVENGDVTVERRTVPVTYPMGAPIIAVTRLEVAGVHGAEVARVVARAIESAGAPFRPTEYQVDFDAVRSQRPFYALLLREIRGLVGDARLSITALASWCMADNWIGSLPIDAAVPMVYRLGPERESILASLRSKRRFVEPVCAGNVAYSADEEPVPLDGLERVFLFHAHPWTLERFRTFTARLEALR